MNLVTAPPGWGWPSGLPIAGYTPEMLPELPLLRVLPAVRRNAAIVTALRENPGLLRFVKPTDLKQRYGLKSSSASEVINRARVLAEPSRGRGPHHG